METKDKKYQIGNLYFTEDEFLEVIDETMEILREIESEDC